MILLVWSNGKGLLHNDILDGCLLGRKKWQHSGGWLRVTRVHDGLTLVNRCNLFDKFPVFLIFQKPSNHSENSNTAVCLLCYVDDETERLVCKVRINQLFIVLKTLNDICFVRDSKDSDDKDSFCSQKDDLVFFICNAIQIPP